MSGPPSLTSMLSGTGTANGTPQSLEQLLERQWEQGSQFLMEQAQHFDSKKFKFNILELYSILQSSLPSRFTTFLSTST